jgi:heterodisulfide reductase subunit A2
MKNAVVVGAGVTGCSAALELARLGSSVTVLERSPRIGGKVLSYCCKATDSCSRCGVCLVHDTIAEAIRNPKIRFLPNASVKSVDGSGDKVTVKAVVSGPRIDLRACIDCGKCLSMCPERSISRYSRAGLVHYAVDLSTCRVAAGKECDLCTKACPVDAIDATKASIPVRVAADGVIVATGHGNFDPVVKPRLGYRRLPGVMTGFEAEQALVGRLDLGGQSVAFIQCVGSRDPSLGRNFCSAVCCAYALRMARVLKTRNPQSDVTVYYIDIQHFDKVQSAFRADVERAGVKLVRGIPSSVSPSDGRLALAIDDPATGAITALHDTVVLSAGMESADGAPEVAARFGLGRDAFGFFTAPAGLVRAAGTCVEPQDLFAAMASGRAAALDLAMAAREPAGAAR